MPLLSHHEIRERTDPSLTGNRPDGADMTLTYAVDLSSTGIKGTEIGASSFGINLVLGYERFGTLPWEKFDEVQYEVGSTEIRFPGGTEAEVLFDYAHPNATSAITSDGTVRQLIPTDSFLDYCATSGSKATITLPVNQLLTDAKYGTRDFDSTMTDLVRSYIAQILEKAGPQGVVTFELGNEYESYMTSQEYGRVASHLALVVQEEIEKYYDAHQDYDEYRPKIAVQVWGQSQGGTYSIDDLSGRNQTVIGEFSASELAAVTAVTSHFYYNEGANEGQPNFHSYSNIQNSVGFSLSMMNEWSIAAGRTLDTIFSEWNLNLHDSQNYGLQQAPILLELFSDFLYGGVDQLDFWSTMYHATSLGNYQGSLQTAGVLFQLMTEELIGTRVAEIPVSSSDFDVHAFSGHGKAVIFVSSMSDLNTSETSTKRCSRALSGCRSSAVSRLAWLRVNALLSRLSKWANASSTRLWQSNIFEVSPMRTLISRACLASSPLPM